MLYALLRTLAGVALRWYYRSIQIEGFERIPRRGPLLVVVNHPNALVDALLVGWIMPRRVLLTAKSTLFFNPIASRFFHRIGVLPLRRIGDDAAVPRSRGAAPTGNRDTFRAVHDALAGGGAVLVFPEGRTHDEPTLAPLKSGAARMALDARRAGDIPHLIILPIGLSFERKEVPRSRVVVQVGAPLPLDDWQPPATGSAVDALTAEIDTRLRAVTLNYATTDDAARAIRIASLVAALFDDDPSLGVDRGFGVELALARRIDTLTVRLATAGPDLRATADQLVERLEALQDAVVTHHVRLDDIRIAVDGRRAARFLVREGVLLLIGAPLALWGRVNHWLPFRAARFVAMQSVESAADPAMRTIIAGAGLVLLTYLIQTIVVGMFCGPLVALLYLVTLPIAADLNFLLTERARRAARRARVVLRLHHEPALRERWTGELAALRADALALDRTLGEPAVEARSEERSGQ